MINLVDLVIVRRKESENKWWNRLFTVLVIASTIVVLLITGVIFYPNKYYWKKYEFTSFSFEPKYPEAKGESVYCEYKGFEDNYFVCGEYVPTDITKRFNGVMKEKYSLPDVPESCLELNTINQSGLLYRLQSSFCESEKQGKYAVYIKEHEDERKNFYAETRAKIVTTIVWGILLKYIGLVLAITVGWFIFWESITYRTVLYIIFGSRKNQKS